MVKKESNGVKVKVEAKESSSDSEKEAIKDPGDFSNFAIEAETITRLQAKGIKSLFPIQYKTFDAIMGGKDVIAQASTLKLILVYG